MPSCELFSLSLLAATFSSPLADACGFISTAMNLIVAFAVSLKHKLRFEPYTNYEDLAHLVGHLDTLAIRATHDTPLTALPRQHSKLKATGEYLGVSFATSNPRKAIKRAVRPLGNLPLEIICYIASFIDEIIENGQLSIPMQQTLACMFFSSAR